MESTVRSPAARYRLVTPPVFVTRRLRGGVELLLSFLVWGLLVALAVSAYQGYVERAYVAEVLTHAITIKQEMTASRAETGHWPTAVTVRIPPVKNRKHPAPEVEYAEGAFTFVLLNKTARRRVSFRAAVAESSPRAPVFWLCGYASPPAGYRVIARNQTDIPMLYLPAACRGDT